MLKYVNFELEGEKNMKKIALVLVLCLCGTTNIQVYALEMSDIVNYNNILITKKEYYNLLNLGFSENEILNMSLDEYNFNKDLKGLVVSQNTIYLDEKNNVLNNSISAFGIQAGYIETAAKQMTTTIISFSNQYRYKISLEWKKIPSTRSYDIIGIGTDNNVKIASALTFQQNFCYSSNNCSSSIVRTEKSTSTGATATFQIPTQTIVSLSSYLYFDVSKNTNSIITQLNDYRDYYHPTKSISKSNANNHSINRGGIILDSSISNYYDSIDTAKATWTGSW